MATTIKHLTYDDLEAIPQEREGDRHEIINGELVVSASPEWDHQSISDNIVFALNLAVRTAKLGKIVAAPIDVRLAPDTVLVPDLIFISRERLAIGGPRIVDGAPDLVVEILSLGTRRRDLTVKRDLYARFGVQEYWIVDPANRSPTVLGLAGDRYEPIPPAADGTRQSRVLPGLALTLDAVIEEIP